MVEFEVWLNVQHMTCERLSEKLPSVLDKERCTGAALAYKNMLEMFNMKILKEEDLPDEEYNLLEERAKAFEEREA